MKRTCKRRKAFLGAIIGAVTSIAGSAISAASQRKAQEKQIKRENYINRNQSANNLSATYSNEEYIFTVTNTDTLANTGQFYYSIIILMILGSLCLLFGVIELKKGKHE